MASTYTLNNGIELIGTGEQSGTWGDTTNANLELLDTALDGQVTITASSAGNSGSPNSLPITDGSASNGRNRLINITSGSDLGATVFYQLTPNDAEKIVYIRNSLNAQDLIVFQGTYNSSNDYVIPNGTTAVVFFNGAGSGAVAANVFNNAHFDAMNVVGGVTITTADNTTQLTLISTDADANVGPQLELYRNSGSPADSDILGFVTFKGRNDNSQDVVYAGLQSYILDASDGTEDGYLVIDTMVDGTARERISIDSTTTTFNEEGRDLNFRVESNNLPNMLFVDGSEDKVFIGHNTTHQYDAYGAEIMLQIEATGTAPYAGIGMVQNSNDADSAPLIFGKSRGTSVGSTTIVQNGDLLGRIEFQGMDGADLETGASIFAVVDGTPGSGDMPGRLVFNTTADGANSATERMRIASDGITTMTTRMLTLKDEETNNTRGPILNLSRDNSDAADNDAIGTIIFNADDDANNQTEYASIMGFIEDASNTTEDGGILFRTATGSNTLIEKLRLGSTEAVFNEDSADVDFRIESNDNANMLYVDAGNNRIGIRNTGYNTTADLNLLGKGLSLKNDVNGNNNNWSLIQNDTNSDQANIKFISGSGNMELTHGSGLIISPGQDGYPFVFNEPSRNCDFRVESDSNAHALFIDASENKILIGASGSTVGAQLVTQNENNTYALLQKSNNSITNGTADANFASVSRAYSTVSSGNKLTIPVTSQGGLWHQYYVEVQVVSGEYNISTTARAGKAEFSFVSLTVNQNLTEHSVSGNISSISLSGMNIEINFSSAYTSGLSNYEGVLVYATVLGRDPSLILWNSGALN